MRDFSSILSAVLAKNDMVIEQAKLENGWLCLKTQPSDALKWLYKFKQGKNYEITEKRKKRSLDANAYAWVLLDKMSAELGSPKEELYQDQIRKIGGVCDIICIQNKALDKFRKQWEGQGIGWQTEELESKLDGCTNLICYYGSSAFDTKQMSRLLDSIIADCKELGIETRNPEEIASLLEEWNEK